MFCDRCGTNMVPGAQVCSGCAKTFVPLMPPAHKLDGHIRLLGILWLALEALRLIPGLVLLIGSGFLISMLPPDFPAFLILAIPIITALLWVNLIGGVIVGYGLLTRKHWARMAAIVVAILNLWELPFGTALSVYTLWALLPAENEKQYRQMSEPAIAAQ